MTHVESQTHERGIADALFIFIEVVLVIAMNRIIVWRVQSMEITAFVQLNNELFGLILAQLPQILLHALRLSSNFVMSCRFIFDVVLCKLCYL